MFTHEFKVEDIKRVTDQGHRFAEARASVFDYIEEIPVRRHANHAGLPC